MAPSQSGGREGTVRRVARGLARAFVRRLGLEYCVVYLYDPGQVNLTEVASSGARSSQGRGRVLPVEGGALGDLAVTPGRPGGEFSIPLWDGRRVLGVVHGRLRPDRVLDRAVTELGRAVAEGGSLALAVALTAGGGPGSGPAAERKAATRLGNVSLLNPHLYRYLEAALSRTCVGGPVALALLRLRGRAATDYPTRGLVLGGPSRDGWVRVTGRVFGLDAGSNQVAMVLLRTGRAQARRLLGRLAEGTSSLTEACGRAGDALVSAAAFSVYPEDGADASSLFAASADLLDLQTYLQATRRGERGDPVDRATGGSTVLVMDSHVLAEEIDRQRQVLRQAIASGLGFQDQRVREISERLDRLIVVMQRFMGHRGAVS